MARPRERTKGRVSDHVVLRAWQYGSRLPKREIKRVARKALDGEGDGMGNGMFLLSKETVRKLMLNVPNGNMVEAIVNNGVIDTIKDTPPDFARL